MTRPWPKLKPECIVAVEVSALTALALIEPMRDVDRNALQRMADWARGACDKRVRLDAYHEARGTRKQGPPDEETSEDYATQMVLFELARFIQYIPSAQYDVRKHATRVILAIAKACGSDQWAVDVEWKRIGSATMAAEGYTVTEKGYER